MSEHTILGPGGSAFLGMRCMFAGADMKSAGSLNSGVGELVPKPTMKLRGPASPSLKSILDTAAGWLGKATIDLGDQLVTFRTEKRGDLVCNAEVKLAVILEEGPNCPASLLVSLRLAGADDDPGLAEIAPMHGAEGVILVRPPKDDQGALPFEPGAIAPVVTIHAPGLATVETQASGDDLYEEIEKVAWDMTQVKAGNMPAPGTSKAKPRLRKGKGSAKKSGKDLAGDQGDDPDPMDEAN